VRDGAATALLYVGSGVLGLLVGSFLNVVVARIPEGRSVTRPRSACPGCATPIAARDNVPLLSWVLLRGRCRHCREPISRRYPAVEASTAALWVAVALRFGPTATTAALDAFAAGLIALAFIDAERYLLPKRIVYTTAALSGACLLVGAAADGQWARLGTALGCAAGAFVLFFALHAVNPRWLGFGDVRLAAVIGLVLGWLGVPYLLVGLLAANLAGVAVAVVLMAAGRMRRTTPMPYGVFLAGGSLLAALVGSPLTRLFGS
jgi:leader peptidase (prepilin peptidase)/N-methyltransferase